jgi:hypothetical protein
MHHNLSGVRCALLLLHLCHTSRRTVSAHRGVGPGSKWGHPPRSRRGGRTGRTSDPVFGPIFVFFGILSAGGGSTSSYRCRQRGGICCPVLISEYRRLNSPETAVGGVCPACTHRRRSLS